MLVGDAGDLHVAELIGADQPVQVHVAVEAVQLVMVEMGVGGDADIHLCQREIMKVPVPLARRMVAPRVQHHRDARGRSQAEGGGAEIGKLYGALPGT